MRWDWETFPEYLESLDRQGLGLNIGALFPFSPLRGYVMGMMEARTRKTVTVTELNEMKRLFHEEMEAGAFGIAGNRSAEDHPEDGGYLPSHIASDEEWLGLMEVLAAVRRRAYWVGHRECSHVQQLAPTARATDQDDGHQWPAPPADPWEVQRAYNWMNEVRAKGIPGVRAGGGYRRRTASPSSWLSINLYDILPNWVQPLVGDAEERMAKLQAPGVREAMKADVERARGGGTITSVSSVALPD